ncbi:hypothetical protein ABFS82_14G248500 [Erythranthe guttata]|uniref:Uncharacterized protein n=1 Tax=Erythranthe guttata TaxID=4155 RepID=A0A022R919_ERYGU|nr:PREDICTED: uncharacterized protein LOC105958892 [Erythranthe guttata]EYU36238.1 hypothetical protein MIMGU_mgv1a022236mg [Erythranthe guttata]|eukprot:XP_012838349.1 PREDICTED: uncharacterized protein LOC105958892 [Erythranthe guttata]
MASTCISSCIEDARVPVRASYVNLYKWPESDYEFVRSMSSKTVRKNTVSPGHNSVYGHPRVVDSVSCRQLYLRSYTFSREEDYTHENTAAIKCLGRRSKDKTAADEHSKNRKSGGRKKRPEVKRSKSVSSCSALASIFRRLLSCTTKIDVAN